MPSEPSELSLKGCVQMEKIPEYDLSPGPRRRGVV